MQKSQFFSYKTKSKNLLSFFKEDDPIFFVEDYPINDLFLGYNMMYYFLCDRSYRLIKDNLYLFEFKIDYLRLAANRHKVDWKDTPIFLSLPQKSEISCASLIEPSHVSFELFPQIKPIME